jgi:hypothetical protein
MTASRAGTTLALLAGAALLVTACGNAAATVAPTSPPITQAPPSSPPTEAPSQAAPTFALPSFSFTADAALEAMFPKEVGGMPLTVQSMAGADFMRLGGGASMGPALQQLGKTADDLSVAFGGTADGSLIVFAFRIKGVNAEAFLGAFTASAQGATITNATLGGKSVKKVLNTGQTVYLYLHQDMIWTVGGTAPTDAVLNEVFSKLP